MYDDLSKFTLNQLHKGYVVVVVVVVVVIKGPSVSYASPLSFTGINWVENHHQAEVTPARGGLGVGHKGSTGNPFLETKLHWHLLRQREVMQCQGGN
jgi:hypothetical protein